MNEKKQALDEAKYLGYAFPKLKSTVVSALENDGGRNFTVGGLLALLDEAGIRESTSLDNFQLRVPFAQMIQLFGVPDVKVGTLEELEYAK